MAQCATTALAGAVPRPSVRGACGRFGGLGPVPGVVSLPFPPSRFACPALRVAGRPVRVSLTLARWYTIPRSLCVPRARSGCPSGSPRVPFACVCARAPAASATPPPGWCGVRTSCGPGTGRWYGRSTWSVPLRVSCSGPLLRLACLGGGGPVLVPPYLAWGCAPPVGRVRGVCPVGAACRGGRGGASPGGVACHRCEGRLVSGAVPPLAACPLERAAGVPRPVCPGCGRSGCGDPATAPQRAPLRAGVARCGGGGRPFPGGVIQQL